MWAQRSGRPAQEDVSVPGSCVEILLEYTFVTAQMHRMPEKNHNFSLLTLGTKPSPCLFVLLSSTLAHIC